MNKNDFIPPVFYYQFFWTPYLFVWFAFHMKPLVGQGASRNKPKSSKIPRQPDYPIFDHPFFSSKGIFCSVFQAHPLWHKTINISCNKWFQFWHFVFSIWWQSTMRVLKTGKSTSSTSWFILQFTSGPCSLLLILS